MPTGIYKRTAYHKNRISAAKKGMIVDWVVSGAKHHLWRGNKAGYSPCHKRVYKARGKASECKELECTKKSKRFEWANLTGHYEDVNDYRSMCKSCHAKYDQAQYNLPHMQYA